MVTISGLNTSSYKYMQPQFLSVPHSPFLHPPPVAAAAEQPVPVPGASGCVWKVQPPPPIQRWGGEGDCHLCTQLTHGVCSNTFIPCVPGASSKQTTCLSPEVKNVDQGHPESDFYPYRRYTSFSTDQTDLCAC